MAFVPDHDFEELCWEDGQLVVMQGLTNRGNKNRSWPIGASDPLSECDTPLTAVPTTDADDTLTGGLIDSSTVINYTQEDELLSWLQHPLDETFEKYYRDTMCDTPNPNTVLKDCEKNCPSESVNPRVLPNASIVGQVSTGPTSRNAALSKHTPTQAPTRGINSANDLCQGDVFQQLNGALSSSGCTGSNITASAVTSSRTTLGHESMMVRSQMLPPQIQPSIASCASETETASPLNFSLFSRPAAAIKANLQTIGMASGPTGTERVKRWDRVPASNSESTESTKNANLSTVSIHQTVQSLSSRKEADPAMSAEDAVDGNCRVGVKSYGWNSCVTSSDVPGAVRDVEALEAAEQTVSSSSGGSGNTASKDGEVIAGCGKRKVHVVEDSECQSKDSEDEPADRKKPATGRSLSLKRSRAAEIHNQSERRRRDRINEKMRALQELIPNCNKTDKASLLEEAIDYMKTLQTQLQMMCYRSGMSVSPLLIPQGIQHLQMAAFPHMGMGVGMGMGMGMGLGMGVGMGMGMLDMNAVTLARHYLPMPSLSGSIMPTMPGSSLSAPAAMTASALPVSGPVAARRVVAAGGRQASLQSSNSMSQKLYFSPQHQQPLQVVNKGMYDTLIAHQHQLLHPPNFNVGTGTLQ